MQTIFNKKDKVVRMSPDELKDIIIDVIGKYPNMNVSSMSARKMVAREIIMEIAPLGFFNKFEEDNERKKKDE